ncbi:MAG: hypothetical protein L0Z62_09405 [Gemmataceae bacterium]|nr:hypothetical protein [Gemmataceae bacterium]
MEAKVSLQGVNALLQWVWSQPEFMDDPERLEFARGLLLIVEEELRRAVEEARAEVFERMRDSVSRQ